MIVPQIDILDDNAHVVTLVVEDNAHVIMLLDQGRLIMCYALISRKANHVLCSLDH